MRCPNCGAENPEGKKFCGDCGATIPIPPSTQPQEPLPTQLRRSWIASNWKAVVSVVIIIVVVLAIVGLVYTQPWSKIKVILNNAYAPGVGINMTIDNDISVIMNLPAGTTIVGVWPVKTGGHVVALDYGTWELWKDYYGTIYYDNYEGPDGIIDYAYKHSVGPLYTKNVYIDINPLWR